MISSHTAPGASPVSPMMRFTCAGSAGSANWRAERLRLSFSVAPACPCHVAIWLARVLDRPEAERHDRAVGLRLGQELTGQQQAVLRVLPAHERLEARDPAGRAADDREVVEPQLVTCDRTAELADRRTSSTWVLSLISIRAPPPPWPRCRP